jgi:predicted nucleic acid-binding protein
MRSLVDTNILLRWVKPDDRDYEAVKRVIDDLLGQGAKLCYTSQNLAEFWNVCTRPADDKGRGYGLNIRETNFRADVIERNLDLLPDGPEVHKEWRKIVVTYAVHGVQVHDARLVASMRVHGVEKILTFTINLISLATRTLRSSIHAIMYRSQADADQLLLVHKGREQSRPLSLPAGLRKQ